MKEEIEARSKYLRSLSNLTRLLRFPINCVVLMFRISIKLLNDIQSLSSDQNIIDFIIFTENLLNVNEIIEKLKVLFMNMSYQSCHTLFEEISPLLNQTSYKFLNFFDKNKIENRTENISEIPVLNGLSFIKYSKSPLWSKQQEYYKSNRIKAFESVPNRISSNSFVVEFYLNYIEDLVHTKCKTSNKALNELRLLVVEIGAGHGIFSYLLAKAIEDKQFNSLVVCTDFHDSIINDLLKLPWVAKLCEKEAGRRNEKELHLIYSQTVLSSLPPFDLLVIVGNYAFDSFPVDLTVCNKEGKLLEIGHQQVATSATSSSGFVNGIHSSSTTPMEGTSKKIKAKSFYTCRELGFLPPNSENNYSMTDSSYEQQNGLGNMRPTQPRPEDHQEEEEESRDSICWEAAVRETARSERGMHVIPSSGKQVLTFIKATLPKAVGSIPMDYALMIGDCFMDSHDPDWQLPYFDSIVDTPEKKVYLLQEFDLPQISPNSEALAIPLTKTIMNELFCFSFTSKDVSEFYSSNLQSVYSVLFLSTIRKVDLIYNNDCSNKKRKSISLDPDTSHPVQDLDLDRNLFGPNEFITLWEILTEKQIKNKLNDKNYIQDYLISAYQTLHLCDNFDFKLFIEIKWNIRKAYYNIIQYYQSDNSLSPSPLFGLDGLLSWITLAEKAYSKHYSTSISEYRQDSYVLFQWLLSLNIKYADETVSRIIENNKENVFVLDSISSCKIYYCLATSYCRLNDRLSSLHIFSDIISYCTEYIKAENKKDNLSFKDLKIANKLLLKSSKSLRRY